VAGVGDELGFGDTPSDAQAPAADASIDTGSSDASSEASGDAIVCKSDSECSGTPCRTVLCGPFATSTCGGVVPAVCSQERPDAGPDAGPGTNAGSVTMGVTAVLPADGTGYLDQLIAQAATLDVDATVQSLSIYVSVAVGRLRLGLYDNLGTSGGPGAKLAETPEVNALSGWNTANVTVPVLLRKGGYWLAFTPSSDALRLAADENPPPYAVALVTYGPLTPSFDGYVQLNPRRWSFYATLTP
jgi:hypothetical protein